MKLKTIVVSILSVIVLLLVNTLILIAFLRFNPSLLIYNHQYQSHHQEMLAYLLSGNDQKLNKMLPQDEFKHIQDVRRIIAKIPLTIFLIIAVASYLTKMDHKVSINEVINYSFISLLLLFLVGTFLFMPFFIVFHEVLFPQGNWSFPTNSILIQLYPEKFWQYSLIIIGVITTVELILVKYFTNQRQRKLAE